ncbi:maltose transporter permease [compost metagenome]
MTMAVYNFVGQYASQWNLVFADLILTALPVLLIYLFAQRYIVSGLTVGAVKS